ncbi:hypothetical protein C8J56DRAFT_934805 [Mycena floridula]|nr:hypothetical protein C8J56DRAFT_934805 [Mycena floridula]
MPSSRELPAVPKLDKSQFIQSFIQGQKAHAANHADEGRSVVLAWDKSPQKPKPVSVVVGFGTPVLKPRVPNPNVNVSEKSSPVIEKKTAVNKKRAHKPSSDNEQAERLAERRERKRSKKAIVRPESPKQVPEKRKKPKLPTGLALMHGFSATNIGKNRITMNSLPKIGVFTKGKASAKAQVSEKKKSTVNRRESAVYFSEAGFLNKKRSPTAAPSSSVSTSDSEIPLLAKNDDSDPPARKGTKPKIKQPVPEPEKEESEIWDIEKSDYVLPSEPPAESIVTQCIDTRKLPWAQESVCKSQLEPSSPSIGPSQSASQYRLVPQIPSKYFSTQNEHVEENMATAALPSSPSHRSIIPDSPTSPQEDLAPPEFLHPLSTVISQAWLPSPFYTKHPETFDIAISNMDLDFQLESYDLEYPNSSSIMETYVPWAEPMQPESLPSHSEMPTYFEPFPGASDLFHDVVNDDDWAAQLSEACYDDCRMVESCFLDESNPLDIYSDSPDGDDGDWVEPSELEMWNDFGQQWECDEFRPITTESLMSVESESDDASRFIQGRELLRGLSQNPQWTLSSAEVDVAKNLKGHWYPQRL